MDKETEKHIMEKLLAMRLRMNQDHIEFGQIVEEFAIAIGKRSSEIFVEEEVTITWPAHMKPPKKNGNGSGNGRNHRRNKTRKKKSNYPR